MSLDTHAPTTSASSPSSSPSSSAAVVEEPSVQVFVADLAQAERAAQILMRAGFHVAGNTRAEAPDAGLLAVDKAAAPRAETEASGPGVSSDVARADLAVRVTRAAECLDDPTTTLMANLDTLQTDIAEGGLRPDDVGEVVADCVVAVRQLLDGIQRLKAVAAPPVLEQDGVTELDLVLRDALMRHRRRSSVPVAMPPISGIRVRGGRVALGQAVANVLEVFAERHHVGSTESIRVTTARGGDGLRLFVCDGGPDLEEWVGSLLSGGTRAQSLDALALLAASSLVRGVGGKMRVADVPGRACLELTLPLVDDTDA